MSIGALGVIGSIATGQLQQSRGADADRATQDARTQIRERDVAQQAEAAEGIGKTSQDEGTSDRDADGRRFWEQPAQRPAELEEAEASSSTEPHPLDPTGESGGTIDLVG